jgi:hypothetical protein
MATVNHPVDAFPVRNLPMTRPCFLVCVGWEHLLNHPAPSRAKRGKL